LLAAVDRKPVQPDRGMNKVASELETNILVFSHQFHSESRAHVRQLESWKHWSGDVGYVGEPITLADARIALEEVLACLNRKFNGRGRLPSIPDNAPRPRIQEHKSASGRSRMQLVNGPAQNR
jgi:hypothetical protein